jgi:hypothetical protein
MNPRKLPFVLLALCMPTHCLPGAEPKKDPLPDGALVRFGDSRPILRAGPAVGLITSDLQSILAPTITTGLRAFEMKSGRPLEKVGIVGPGQVVVSGNGQRAVVARPGAIEVIDVANPKHTRPIQAPDGVAFVGLPSVALSHDGKRLAFGGRGRAETGVIVVLDLEAIRKDCQL